MVGRPPGEVDVTALAPAVLAAWDWPAPVTATPLADGLINASWRLDDPRGRPVAALQRLNTAIFDPAVHHDIAGLTAVLAAAGVPVPRLIPTRDDTLWLDHDGAWRALTWVGERTIHAIDAPGQARSAGALVGRFHAALHGVEWTFHFRRPGPHDTDRHAATLRAALAAHRDHALYDAVAPLADRLLARWDALRAGYPTDLPPRILHGDLKVSNLRFDGDTASAIVDLDTLQHGTLDAEWGDALRSWCGTKGEDVAEGSFDLAVLEAALTGLASVRGPGAPTDAEWAAIVPGTERICTELAMRFAADALEESYFGWDAARFARAGDHNLLRARGQASQAEAVAAVRADAERVVARARRA